MLESTDSVTPTQVDNYRLARMNLCKIVADLSIFLNTAYRNLQRIRAVCAATARLLLEFYILYMLSLCVEIEITISDILLSAPVRL